MGAAESSKYVPYKAIRYLKFINSDLAYIGMNSQELAEEIDRIWAQYHTAKNEIKKKPELYAESYPVSAFVLFKSFNDRKRVINAFQPNNKRNLLSWWLKTPFSAPIYYDLMYVEEGMEPELLIWPNFSIKKYLKVIYKVLFWTAFASMVFLSGLFVHQLKSSNQELANIPCEANVDVVSATLDYMGPAQDRNGRYNCFCR